jgi:hypothetical protein
MWQVNGKPYPVESFGSLRPVKVLAAYDYPRAFTFRGKAGEELLAYWCADDDETDRFIVVPCRSRAAVDLERGKIPIRAALDQPSIWIVDVDSKGVKASWQISGLGEVPAGVLPAPDVRFEARDASREK